MDVVLYIPYVDSEIDESKFNYNGGDFDYLSRLDSVGGSIIGADNYFNQIETPRNSVGFYSNNKTNSYDDYGGLIKYMKAGVVLLDVNGGRFNYEKLVSLSGSDTAFMLDVAIKPDEIDDEASLELRSWISESNKIISLPDDLYDEAIKISLQPKRDFRFDYSGESFILGNCMFFDFQESIMTIYVNNVKKIK